ncbi:tyrosine-protein kinase CSK [Planoprotostelium fungivorum]|uniref:Tyrosine-protein kinase CSK n=1 Tax=Planoprotostelium fungivorum TaxID=1890364 RepID=A0A2P6N975_9EUKA|nr:tyrosine-protein kinase CSK [Planoprotostelium fungivorum]
MATGRESRKRVSTVNVERDWEATVKSLVQECTDTDVSARPDFVAIAKRMTRMAAAASQKVVEDSSFDPYEDSVTAKVTNFSACVTDGTKYRKKAAGHTAPEVRESGIQRKAADVWSYGLLLSFIASDGKNAESQAYQNEPKRRIASAVAEKGWDTTIQSLVQECTDTDAPVRPSFIDINRRMSRSVTNGRGMNKASSESVDPYSLH